MPVHSKTLNVPYDLEPSGWEALLNVYKAMPGWIDSARDGCPFWRPDGTGGGAIMVSAEPSGLLFEADVAEGTWTAWIDEFKHRATAALGFVVHDADN